MKVLERSRQKQLTFRRLFEVAEEGPVTQMMFVTWMLREGQRFDTIRKQRVSLAT